LNRLTLHRRKAGKRGCLRVRTDNWERGSAMIIICHSCSARYKVKDDLVADGPKRTKCKNCGARGPAYLSNEIPFIFAPWYVDSKGLQHGFLYCRSCGTVHDTIGSLLGPIKMLFGSIPSTVVAFYDFPSFGKLMRITGFHSR